MAAPSARLALFASLLSAVLALPAADVPSAAPAANLPVQCPVKKHTVHREPDDDHASYRLSRDVLPQHYDLRIVVNIGDGGLFNTTGHVDILAKAATATSQVKLHARGLAVDAVQVKELPARTDVPVKSQAMQPEDEQLVLELAQPLRAGVEYLISIPFYGNLSSDLHGLYKSSYYDKKSGTTKWLAVSHFEATHAREAFPCFDEPAMKATFTVSLGHKSSLTALSNMPAEKTEPLPGHPEYTLTSFPKSVPMSTYLVAFVISDFEGVLSEKKENEAQVGLWARRDALEQTRYAREIAPRALRFFEEYFDEKYPLPKQDMIAIPDFSAGAMENWGLITYREAQLLFTPNVTSLTAKGHVANTVVHELAHQWFGNLVTMKWWSDLWLNEGFATYMAALGTAHLHPEWNWQDENAVDQAMVVLPLDALASTHPVVRPIGHPKQITQSFDTITYKKGSALLRMMHSFLGEKAFRQGVANYIKKHKYSNAEQDDLWEALTEEGHRQGTLPECFTVKQIMDTWTVQSGYPLVEVERDYDTGVISIQQSRYFSDPRQHADGSCWYVPLSYTTAAAPNFKCVSPRTWLACDAPRTNLTGLADKDKWVLFNLGVTGVYRVQYDRRNWDLLTAALAKPEERTVIGMLNRVLLLSDSFDLARSGRLTYAVPLRLADTLRHESSHLVWRAGLGSLAGIDRFASKDARYYLFREWVVDILKNVVANMGSLREVASEFSAIKLKALMSSWACKFEMGDCVEQARELFAQWRATPDPDTSNPIPGDMRSLVYCNGIKYGTSHDWMWLWRRYLRSNVASERVLILGSLGCSRDDWVLRRYLEWGVNESSGVRLQDSSYVFNAVARSSIGYPIARQFLFDRVEDITKHYGSPSSSRIGRYVSEIAAQVTTPQEYDDLVKFTKENEHFLTHADQAVRQGLESASNNVQWRKDHQDEVFKIIATFKFDRSKSEDDTVIGYSAKL